MQRFEHDAFDLRPLSNKDPHLYNGKPIEWYIEQSIKNKWMPLTRRTASRNRAR